MGFFKSLKGKVDFGTNAQSAGNTDHDSVDGQQGRPPGYSSEPPSRLKAFTNNAQQDSFQPPPGPPPTQSQSEASSPPPGPPPSQSKAETNPPPYHDWTSVPDTSLLPPPPALPQEASPTNNASYDSAAAAHEWCAANPLYTPSTPSPNLHNLSQNGHLTFDRPPTLARNSTLRQTGPGRYHLKTQRGQQDTVLLSTLPLYFAAVDHPLHTEQEKLIYFEVKILNIRDNESGVAVGFAAKPYPLWRLPGWHRASLAVHGDDGRRYVNDSWGGREFVTAFERRKTVGIGMRFLPQDRGADRCMSKVVFTRNGRVEGGWSVDEERDAERDEGVEGLQGEKDMYAAVGVFGGVECEVVLGREGWTWDGRG